MRSDRIRILRECFFTSPFRHHQCHLCDPRENWFSPLQGDVCSWPPVEDSRLELKWARMESWPVLCFSDEDKNGTIQPHDDALVVTFRIGGYDVKRVLVDQGSGAEIMYPDLYNRLGLKPEDPAAYDSPLVSFDEKFVIPRGQIRLPIQVGLEVVEVDFIIVGAYSLYTATVARP